MVSTKLTFLSALMLLVSVNLQATPIYTYTTPVLTGVGGSVQYEFNFNDVNNDLSLLWTEIESVNYALDGSSLFTQATVVYHFGNFGFVINSSGVVQTFVDGAIGVIGSELNTNWQLVTSGNDLKVQGDCFYNGCQRISVSDIGFNPSAIPEPSTITLFALGALGLAARRFKNQS